jgi:hypothetical protein
MTCAPAACAWRMSASTSSTYTMMFTGLPPRVCGLRKSIAATSSASMIGAAPMRISACPIVPSGCCMRMTSVAPKACR